jgi:hypothetical protein
VILACNNRQNTSETVSQGPFTFRLIDSLGTVSMDFPERTDTFFSWIQRSDCGKPCEQGDYRFQSKRNRIFKESGFFWIGEPEDSVDQLTIHHQRPGTLLKHNDSFIIRDRARLLDKVLNDIETENVLSDTLVRVNGRSFYVLRTADFNGKKGVRDRRLIAFTTVSGTLLEFHYKLLTTRYDTVLTRFFEKSMENLATVRIKDGG